MYFDARKFSRITRQGQVFHVSIKITKHRIRAVGVQSRVELGIGLGCFVPRRRITEQGIDAIQWVKLEESITPGCAVDRSLRIVGNSQEILLPDTSAEKETESAAIIALFSAQIDLGHRLADGHLCKPNQNCWSGFGSDAYFSFRFHWAHLRVQTSFARSSGSD